MTHATGPACTPLSHVLPQHYINRFGRHLRDTLFEQGLWLLGNTIGIAKVGSRVSLVETTPKKSRSGDPWIFFTVMINNWDWCGTGPYFSTFLAGCSFSGYKNLAKYDKKAAGLEVGRSGDFSTPA